MTISHKSPTSELRADFASDPRPRLPQDLRGDLTHLEVAYFRYIESGAALPTITAQSDRIFRNHLALAASRPAAAAASRVYRPNDGAGMGTAVQIVNDDMPLLVESVIATLRRMGAVVTEVVHPIFEVTRDPDGMLLTVAPRDADGNSAPAPWESWMHVQLSPATPAELLDQIEAAVPALLADLRQIIHDTPAMWRTEGHLADTLDDAAAQPGRAGRSDLADCANLLRWLAGGHFTMLGYARYRLDRSGVPRRVQGTGLGVLRDGSTAGMQVPVFGPDRPLLMLTQGSVLAAVHGSVYPYFVGVAEYDESGAVIGEQLFVGMFTVTAVHANILDIPVIERRVRWVIEWAGFDLSSFSGQAMLEVMQSLPRVELFSSDARRLFETTSAVLNLGLRRQVRLFLREDAHSRVVSCLVYLPRDRYTTVVRLRMQDILVAELDGEFIDYSARVTESDLASVYFTVRRREQAGPADTSENVRRHIQELLIEATRTWEDRLTGEAAATGTVDGELAKRYADAFSDGYKQDFEPRQALADLQRLEQLTDGSIDMHLYRQADAAVGDWRFTLYVGGAGVSLSKVLPLLRSLGVEVMDERPYRIDLPDGRQRWIYVFGLRAGAELLRNALDPNMAAQLVDPGAPGASAPGDAQLRFAEAFEAMWFGRAETGELNELVLRARLHWREVAVLRAYAKYLQQAGFAYSLDNISRVLLTHPDAARSFIELFEAYFDPDHPDPELVNEIEVQLAERIDAVVSLDTDRILRAILGLIKATLRSNYYMVDGEGTPRDYVSFKFEPTAVAELPKPRPQFEIFVYSPRVEGAHLRFGSVARGGLRWSDRREDFRTEILGLVKAQAVKNAVIVPVGAKGGFVVKNPPIPTDDPVVDRQALTAEGVACYRLFISGLLDLTDNIDPGGATVPPDRVVRRDGDDSYLVVAADKGTATFSDIANEVAARYDFWLGDAFASGGSVGYDHKAMGITAKGAWEAVKRHFRERDLDTQTTDFTVVGVGDMSGDVFGNGMLCSPHIRLMAAFDHRHIFLDPDPDPAASYAERARMFALSRSSWADYDPTLISAGGGVYDRTTKSVAVSPQARAALGLPDTVTVLSPPEMIRAILLAPADLLWNGGIGTYVKGTAESNADVGDKSNDAVRVNGSQLRVKVVGEGGNLGFTALGRIEYAQKGGQINTDALDNSAGVDCSDHEVNIKVLVDRLVAHGDLPATARDGLLESMTDEVAELVLRDNVSQNFLMGLSRADAVAMLNVHRRMIADLENRRGLDRELEALPSDAEIERRMTEGRGLTSPELANLMAHVKLALKADLLTSDLPDNASFADRLPSYFPTPLRQRFGKAVKTHPLRREIVATMLANDMVDQGGITYAFRLAEEIGAGTTDAVRAFTATAEIFGMRALWHRIRTTDMPTDVRDELELETKRTLDRASRWLLSNRPQPIAIGADINRYATGVRKLTGKVPGWLRGYHVTDLVERSRTSIERGAPPELAVEVFRLIHLFPLLDILDIADITEREGKEVAALYYALNDHLKIEWLLTAVQHLERGDRWHSLARLAVRDDMYSSLRSLTQAVLAAGEPEESAEEKIAYWESTNQSRLARARAALAEIFATGPQDLATLSVAARQVRAMVSGVSISSEVAR